MCGLGFEKEGKGNLTLKALKTRFYGILKLALANDWEVVLIKCYDSPNQRRWGRRTERRTFRAERGGGGGAEGLRKREGWMLNPPRLTIDKQIFSSRNCRWLCPG